MRRLLQIGVLFDRQALDPLPGFLQFALAELQVVAPTGNGRDRVLQGQLAVLEGMQRRIELGQCLLVRQRLVEAHGIASSTVASSRPAARSPLTGWPLRGCSAPLMMPPPFASRVMLYPRLSVCSGASELSRAARLCTLLARSRTPRPASATSRSRRLSFPRRPVSIRLAITCQVR